MKQLLLPAALALGLLTQCHRAEPTPAPAPDPLTLLPMATQTGTRTFGCLLNGQPWTPAGDPFSGALFIAEYGFAAKHLSLVVIRNIIINKVTTEDVIQIEIDNCATAGRYTLNKQDTSFVNYENIVSKCNYYTDATHQATVVLTKLDLVNRIVSGTFAFTLSTPGCGQVVVTDGRFDVKF